MNMKSKGHIWQDEWIVDNYLNYPTIQELRKAYNDKFGTCYKQAGFNRHTKECLKLDSPKLYSDELLKWFIDFYPKNGWKKTSEEMLRVFGRTSTKSSITVLAYRLGLRVDEEIANTNKRAAVDYEGSKRQTKKPGDTHIGQGLYLKMKREDGTWDMASRLVWEKEHGKLEPGERIIFLDRDPTNLSINNLAKVSKEAISIYTGNISRLKSNDPEVSKTLLLYSELKASLKRRSE